MIVVHEKYVADVSHVAYKKVNTIRLRLSLDGIHPADPKTEAVLGSSRKAKKALPWRSEIVNSIKAV